jgi:cholesterol transport system auxiliary component
MRKLMLFAAIPFVAGCLGLAKDYPDRHLHSISAERPGETMPPAKGLVLAVKPFSIASRYEKAEFVYRKSETEWETDYYNAFFVGPKEMLTDATAAWLTRSGLFQHVGSLSGTAPPTHVLEGHVAQLWVDSRTSPPKAVIEVNFLLVDDRETPARIVLTRSWSESTPLAKDSPEEAVRAWGEGLGRILTTLELELGGAVGAR